MLVYLALLLMGLLPALLTIQGFRLKPHLLTLFCVMVVLFTGLRDEIGPDWSGYQNKMARVLSDGMPEVLFQMEPAFSLAMMGSDAMGWDVYGVNLLCAFMFIFGLAAFAFRTPYPWVAISVVMPYLIYVISMSGVRQSAATGICFFLLSRWANLLVWQRIGVILLASAFHMSAFVFTIFLFAGIKMKRSHKLALMVMLVGLLVGIQTYSNFMEKYNTVYVEKNVESKGAIFHVLLSAFPAMLYLRFKKHIDAQGLGGVLLTMAAWLAIGLIPLVYVSSTAASRLSLYFSFLQMWVYPAMIHTFPRARTLLTLFVAMVTLSIFLVYFVFGSYVYAYVPYRNVLIGEVNW